MAALPKPTSLPASVRRFGNQDGWASHVPMVKEETGHAAKLEVELPVLQKASVEDHSGSYRCPKS